MAGSISARPCSAVHLISVMAPPMLRAGMIPLAISADSRNGKQQAQARSAETEVPFVLCASAYAEICRRTIGRMVMRGRHCPARW